jgi:tight adherence protein B
LNLDTRAGWKRARATSVEHQEVAAAVRSLAALIDAGLTPRAALIAWGRDVKGELGHITDAVGRRAGLGAPTAVSLRPLAEAMSRGGVSSLEAAFDLHAHYGGDLADLVRKVAERIERRGGADQEGRVAAAGASLSGRLVAALPVAFVPLAPAARAPLFDRLGIFVLVVGIGLALAGMRWIRRLVPSPAAQEDAVSVVAETAAAFLKGGGPIGPVLTAAAAAAPEELAGELARCHRLTQLGLPWASVLGTSEHEGLRALSGVLRRSAALGLPARAQLESFAAMRRERARRELEHGLRRAPVLMVIPLAVCVLPSFVLLAIVPFLRGLSLHG